MRHICIPAVLIVIATVLCGCDKTAGYGGKISRPEESHVDLSDDTLTNFDDGLHDTLFRYLAGNPRWEIREERGLRYAVRLNKVNGNFQTTLNGFYSSNENGEVRQTRVLLSFGKPYGFGRDRGNITRVKPGSNDVSLIIEGEHAGTPGHSSYAIINGGQVFLEIYDQAPELARTFTQAAFEEVCAELKGVIKHRKQVDSSGILPVLEWYPKPLPAKRHFQVKDGMQPGIYLVDGAVNPTEPGFAYIKAFNTQTGERLSKERMTGRSVRYLGWSDDGNTFFPYGSEVTVYEGDWSSTYEARFELWHRSDKGVETKLAEMTRMIHGWQR